MKRAEELERQQSEAKERIAAEESRRAALDTGLAEAEKRWREAEEARRTELDKVRAEEEEKRRVELEERHTREQAELKILLEKQQAQEEAQKTELMRLQERLMEEAEEVARQRADEEEVGNGWPPSMPGGNQSSLITHQQMPPLHGIERPWLRVQSR